MLVTDLRHASPDLIILFVRPDEALDKYSDVFLRHGPYYTFVPIPIVKTQWAFDCIVAGELVEYAPYLWKPEAQTSLPTPVEKQDYPLGFNSAPQRPHQLPDFQAPHPTPELRRRHSTPQYAARLRHGYSDAARKPVVSAPWPSSSTAPRRPLRHAPDWRQPSTSSLGLSEPQRFHQRPGISSLIHPNDKGKRKRDSIDTSGSALPKRHRVPHSEESDVPSPTALVHPLLHLQGDERYQGCEDEYARIHAYGAQYPQSNLHEECESDDEFAGDNGYQHNGHGPHSYEDLDPLNCISERSASKGLSPLLTKSPPATTVMPAATPANPRIGLAAASPTPADISDEPDWKQAYHRPATHDFIEKVRSISKSDRVSYEDIRLGKYGPLVGIISSALVLGTDDLGRPTWRYHHS